MKAWKKVVPVLMILLLAGLVGCGQSSKETAGTVQRFETMPPALLELTNRGIDAVVGDSPVVLEYIKSNPSAKLRAFPDDNFEKEFYGIAMRQEDTDLHKLVNDGLAAIKANGVYDKLYAKYFGDGSDYVVPESENTLNLTYNVAQDMAYAPLESINAAGEPEGFDCDLIRSIAAEMGFAVNLVNTNWDGIIPSLVSGTSDIIISAMTITEERQKSVTFSDPYFEATQYIVVNEDSDINSLADLVGKTVGVQNATTGDIAITKYFEAQ
ncbi:MAG TPA: transporter substrate-binding domain-containing protein [Oscillospiraceae bacterium]|nr:transporter substrate-binding domain-containing protein [Oscillospiraceae bacterium]